MLQLLAIIILCILGYFFLWPVVIWAFATISGVLLFLLSKITWVVAIVAFVFTLLKILG